MIVVAGLGTLAMRWRPEPAAPIVVTVPPAPIVVPQIELPVPPLPPPPAPAPAPPPPPVRHAGTTCAGDVATIGIPVANAAADAGAVKAHARVAGCTLATWDEHELHVSWDAGMTFDTYKLDATVYDIAVAPHRIVALRDHVIDVILPNADPVARPLPAGAGVGYGSVVASDAWIARQRDVASERWRPSDSLVAFSADGDGWRYLAMPAITGFDPLLRLELGGDELVAIVTSGTSEPDGNHIVEMITRRQVADLRHPTWQARAAAGWTYQLQGDKFWGCGGSEKLMASSGDTQVQLVGDLRTDNWPFALVARGNVAYATIRNRLERIVGTTMTDLADDPELTLVGIDSANTPIALSPSGRLLRWTARGGWRVLDGVSSRRTP